MTVEFDIKQGTEPETKGNKKKTFTFETRTILAWWMFLVCVSGCMFYLGIITGRESAPVYFDVNEIDSDLMELVDSAVNPENTDVVMPETAETSDLEFYEALKGNKGGNKKIAEIEDTLKYRPKTEDIQPEKFPKKAETAKESTGEQTSEQSEWNADSAENGHLKPGDKTNQPKKNETESSKQSEKSVIKDEKKTSLKKAETENNGLKSGQTVNNEKMKSASASKADNQKKEVKTASEKTKDARHTDAKTTSGAGSPTKKTGNLSSESASIKTPDHQQTGVHQTDASKTQASEKGNSLKQSEVRKTEKPVDKSKESPDSKTEAKPVKKQEKKESQKKETQKSVKYTIQAGAVKTNEDAESMVKKLSASGIGAAVVKGKGSDGSEWYRIRIGSYPDREKAAKMAETVKNAGFPAMVINVPQE